MGYNLGYQKEGYSDLSQDQKIAIIPQNIESVQSTSAESTLTEDPVQETVQSTSVEETVQSYCQDSIVNNVISAFIGRSNLGLQKYGTTLDRDDLSVLDWIQHAQEEHMDAILYLEKLKKELTQAKRI
jgi:hypothetical protein